MPLNKLSPRFLCINFNWENTLSTEQLDSCAITTNLIAIAWYGNLCLRDFHHFHICVAYSPASFFQSNYVPPGSFFFLLLFCIIGVQYLDQVILSRSWCLSTCLTSRLWCLYGKLVRFPLSGLLFLSSISLGVISLLLLSVNFFLQLLVNSLVHKKCFISTGQDLQFILTPSDR